jgi:hypothetical protein
MRFQHYSLVLFCLFLGLLPTTSQAVECQSTKEAAAAVQHIVASALDAAHKSNWQSFARHMHADGLKNFRQALLPVLKAGAEESGNSPPSPAVQAALEVLGIAHADIETIVTLEPEPFFVRVLEASELHGKGRQFLLNVNHRIVGTAFENERLAQVVVEAQRTLQGIDLSSMEVFTVKLDAGNWRLVTSTSLQGMMSLFRLVQVNHRHTHGVHRVTS